ncbi:glutamate receptor 2.8-like [Quercus lobata]|uniref:glutamate receptor 2.8-like n=1 Tax=Quercus lobata TaxID=97700 RepID=UPI00124643F6|nr:glutamate receptor 2.8-like [Quercus lobata]
MSMTMTNQKPLLSKFQSFLLLSLSLCGYEPLVMANELIPVGVVLDLKSPVGRVAKRYMSMALSDFYAVNHYYSTRLSLLTKDSGNDVIAAASAALDLMKNEEVQAIIGPQWSAQAKFVIEIGRKAQVPIISFSATSPSLSPSQNQFFIRTTQDDCVQVKAIANIVDTFGWREIVLIYEDTDYGNGLIPYLLDALQEIDTRVRYRSVIHPSSNNTEIIKELNKLKANHARIFLVHMTASLGSKLFVRAKEADMMSEGYAWILTTGLSSLLDPMGSKVMDSMQGVLGIRPYIPPSKHLKDFERKWKRNLTSIKIKSKSTTSLNFFGLWAYDTVWALAIAVEKAGCIVHSSFLKQNASNNNVDLAALGVFEKGTRLRNTILTTKFQGLSGNFDLVKGQLEPSAFELFNVIGRIERIIGHWTRETNLTLNENLSKNQISEDKLKHPIWPGDTPEQPTKLRIGVPVLKEGFLDFVKVEWDPVIVSGFSIDVFEDVLRALPFHLTYEYIPYANETRQSNGTYDQLLGEINTLKYDAVVGDITIVARRSLYVDFTLPYMESVVSMLVLEKDDESKNLWIFLKPLSINLWLTTGVAFIFTGLVIWTLEHRVNNDFRGPPKQQLGLIFWFSFSTLAFAQRERVVNNWSRFVLIVWIFVVLILTQSYTANLTSMLTVQRLQPMCVDVKEIIKKGYYVGYLKESFVKELLIDQLGFNESNLKAYETLEEYHEALSRGTYNDGVAAIFNEIPYIKLYLAKYCSRYTMVGPIYKIGGFGFVFRRGSPLVPYILRAILNVTQDKHKSLEYEKKYFSSQTTCVDQSTTISSHSPSLGVDSFGGLFIIAGISSLVSLLVYVFKFFYSYWPVLSDDNPADSCWSKLVKIAKHFYLKDLSSYTFKGEESRVHVVASPNVFEPSPGIDDMQNHTRNSTEGSNDVVIHDDNGNLSSSSRHGDASMQDVPNSS